MPPEQITDFRDAKPQADQYAAAASLYNLLTNAYVQDFPQGVHRQLLAILEHDAVPIRERRKEIPEGLAQVIHRALAREPRERWPEVAAFGEALRPYAG
jgi:serine/threonine-protein kinase